MNKKSGIFFTIGIFRWRFKFQPDASNECHDIMMISMSLSDIAILNILGADYHYIMSVISKSEAINLMQNIYLTEKTGHYRI